ncbi:exopolysaccharide biosynthesis protein [Marinobacter sp. VGCF2001]|uniref:exopolysaccharide biosynthesis protein n=1 Tax=Marinobacter sp. VGCF2001 TaxID=3417189 RepID=UPI003CF56C33
MKHSDDPGSLTELVARIRDYSRQQERVSIGDLMSAVGERSFGPLVLMAGIIVVAPLIGDIPGVPTLLGLLVLLTLGQLLCQRASIWVPARLAQRHVARQKLLKGLEWADKPAAFIDRWTKPRLPWLVSGAGQYLMALLCMAVAAAMPVMELIPFSANGGGLALMAFGLSIVARDGLLALVAIAATTGTTWFVLTNLPW